MLERVFTGGRQYWTLVGILMFVSFVGLLTFWKQFNEGLTITGMSRDIPWGFYIAQLTFLVGVAASAVMVVLPYYLHDYKAFGKLTILGEFLAISAVLMCMLFIFVDMGQPFRILNVMLHPTPNSLMFWDMVVLSGYLVLNVLIWVGCAPAQSRMASIDIGCNEFMELQNIAKEIQIAVDQPFTVTLCSNPTTGFQWEPAEISDPTALVETGHRFVSSEEIKPPRPGTVGQSVWTRKALKEGESIVSIAYSRPWKGGEKGAWTFELTVVVSANETSS